MNNTNNIIELKYHQTGIDHYVFEKHFHDNCYEVIQALSNNGRIFISDRTYPIKYGCMYFINAIDMHGYVPEKPESYVRNKIVFNSRFLDRLLAEANGTATLNALFRVPQGRCIEFDMPTAQYMNTLFLELVTLGHDSGILFYSKVLELLSLCEKKAVKDVTPDNDAIAQVCRYINEHISRNITLDEICSHIFISKAYLCRRFKKTTGKTVYEYIKAKRISDAKKMLRFTTDSVSDVAMQTGFSSFSYFSRAFREVTGYSPSEFRKRG